MASTPSAPGARLQKPLPDPRKSRNTLLVDPAFQQPSPGVSSMANMSPADAAEHGILVPPRPFAGVQTPSSASSFDWTSRPGTPTSFADSAGSRPGSRPMTPTTPADRLRPTDHSTLTPPSTDPKDKARRKSWFGRSKDKDRREQGPLAWVVGHQNRVPFDLTALTAGHPVSDIWDPAGDCLVYLFPRSYGRGPSFRINSSVFASSAALTKSAFGGLYSTSNPTQSERTSLEDRTSVLSLSTPPATPQHSGRTFSAQTSQSSRSNYSNDRFDETPREVSLFMEVPSNGKPAPAPTKKGLENPVSEDEQALVDTRNCFAFLTGQSLVATEKRSSLFSIFIIISNFLKNFDFSNLDASAFGEVATSSFDSYIDELRLADVRASRQKTIEAVVLAERMRSVTLYNEAFTHFVGKHDEIEKLNSPTYRLISPVTVNRLGRAAMDLDKRTASVRHILEDFDFPSIFAGMFNSKTAGERKLVNFDSWRNAFFSTRKFVIGYYKGLYGAWPPKASSKKNELETSGLNRLVLRELYHDLSALYDLLVDRESLTNRTADGVSVEDREEDAPMFRALRHILSEYDRSSPPVKPPIPFDLPALPTLSTTRPGFGSDQRKDAKAMGKKLKDDEIATVLQASHNKDSTLPPFVTAYLDFERKSAHSSTIQDICDQRIGQWIFMYAVLQALPMLVIDAPALRHAKGVEYFLCEPPRGGVPWARESSGGQKRNWYGIAGGAGVVSLPSDVIEHSIDGVYRRSHCWDMAQRWTAHNPALNAAVHEQQGQGRAGGISPSAAGAHMADLTPPHMPAAYPRVDSRSSSPSRPEKSKRQSIMLGLEAIPLPAGVQPEMPGMRGAPQSPSLGRSAPKARPVSRHEVDSSKTFDAILASAAASQDKGKKKGKK